MPSFYKTNSKLIALSSTGSTPTGFDPVTGEPIFSQSEIVVFCSLEETSKPQEIVYPGIDSSATYLEGRCINPKSLPVAFKAHTTVDIEYETQTGTLKGKFYLLPTVNSRLGLEQYFGGAVAGFLVLG